LPTYPFKGSNPPLPKMFLFLLVDFKFENWNLKNERERERPLGHKVVKL
jgi:hypothetical protein